MVFETSKNGGNFILSDFLVVVFPGEFLIFQKLLSLVSKKSVVGNVQTGQ